MFSFFERLLKPTVQPDEPQPPATLIAFYWHYARQAKGLFIALFAAGLTVALLDILMPVFMGRVVSLVSSSDPKTLFAQSWHVLLGMALILLFARPAAMAFQSLLMNQAIAANLSNRIRWQNHWHVVRQSWNFFQNDFAGRISSRVMQTGPAVRESIVAMITSIWYILVYGASTILLLASADPRLAIPVLCWFVGYLAMLRWFVPRMRDRSKTMTEMRSKLTGRIVDSYTNILTVKLFARPRDEDNYVRDTVEEHTRMFYHTLRLNTLLGVSLSLLNACLTVGNGGFAIYMWTIGEIQIGMVATALALAWQLVSMSGWIAYQVTGIFENIGVVQEGMMTIAQPVALNDKADARALMTTRGEIRFDNVRFGYGNAPDVISGLNLTVAPGEKIGLIGRSGAGKSTLVNLLLRFFDCRGGRILIDGQDIAAVTQESLRASISMVTQDTSLLHRSIRENISYGRRDATEAEIAYAAKLAHADSFIADLEDWRDRRGYDAHVGERGVKLSGGQRQRIAIARVILKNAPILVLDEATSALDSEVEAAIQQSLDTLMADKTVIAIAHRLSTIARMDRLIVLDGGRIVEQGSHHELLRLNGHYAALWRRQSGGFIDADDAQAAE
jgi:ATP-binding cassette subfamily B multidrug efflux pump